MAEQNPVMAAETHSYDYGAAFSAVRRVMAEDTDLDSDKAVEELVIADYVIFLLALDTYMRYLVERFGTSDVNDKVLTSGLMLLRAAERRHLDAVATYLKGHLASPASIKMLEAAIRPPPSQKGAARRAMLLRTVLSRGGTATMRAVFDDSSKARKEVKEAIEASILDDEDAALERFSAITLRNKRLEAWIDTASDAAKPGSNVLNEVQVATKSTSEDVREMLKERIQQDSDTATDATVSSVDKQNTTLAVVEQDATATAKKVLNKTNVEDKLLTRSEVIGVAKAVAMAVVTDPELPANIPPTLRGLDAEQLSAAMAMGKVIVAAGAGSGKTHTLTSRLSYLVQELGVSPSRIMACTFNKKAAEEISERVSARLGAKVADEMTLGTMHSVFRGLVSKYGNDLERGAMGRWQMPDRAAKAGPRESSAPTAGQMAGFMARIWKECYGKEAPRGASNVIQNWLMNDITPDQASADMPMNLDSNPDTNEGQEHRKDTVEWYRWYLGFKGALGLQWNPDCVRGNEKAGAQWGTFLDKHRNGRNARLGTFDDMIIMARDILRRSPSARKEAQSFFDHIAIDEAQDLNEVQHQIIEMMSEHIKGDDPKKSLFLVGDEIQSINAFAGARPELFTRFGKNPDWKIKNITTNRRCLPEIVEMANTMMADHPRGLPMQARPDPSKPRGAASIVVSTPFDHTQGAMDRIGQIARDVEAGAPLSNYAVLVRNNIELNDYETACIINRIPYHRKGTSSFLKAPETIKVMSYFNLVVGQDFERMQRSLIEVFNRPKRFFLKGGQDEALVRQAIEKRARKMGISEKAVNPLELFDDEGLKVFIDLMDPGESWPSWRVSNAREQLENLADNLRNMRKQVDDGYTLTRLGEKKDYTTQDLLGDILAIEGAPEKFGQAPPTLRQDLLPGASFSEEEADDPDAEKEKHEPIGNVQFLYKIAEPRDKNDADNPSKPRNFKAYIDKLAVDSRDLRVDVEEWSQAQKKLPADQRTGAPCVVLSTVHKVKGAQWKDTTVVMAGGVFPNRRTTDQNITDSDDPEAQGTPGREFLTERQLAYVAFTRAAENLTVICPSINVYGRRAGGNGELPIFAREAQLRVGQNVAGKPDPLVDVPFETKTAFFEDGPEPPPSFVEAVDTSYDYGKGL